MESLDRNGGSRLVVTELSNIKDLVVQLAEHLPGGSHDLCKRLASQILSLIERSIGIITSSNSNFDSGRKRSAADAGLASVTPSSLRELTDVPFNTNKKRKTMEKKKNQVRVSSAGGGETPVDDGHSWRKYGQKEILGAKYPRAYYRCTHRHSQGCFATKQVQRTDDDPTLFNVFYLGTHTCVHKMVAGQDQAAASTQPPEHNTNAQNGSLTVKTETKAMAGDPQGWSATTPLGISSTPASVFLAPPEHSPFSPPSTSDNYVVSPAISDSNQIASFPPLEWRTQSELQEVMSALVVASTLPVPGMDITDALFDIDITSFFA